ncbi:Chlorate reductase assembly chaperone protein [Gammaproteobacteria bacterium]|nr:Chlorate reductase assembly chaperone protein [Gammaproteobacteria bacterium]
MNAAGGTAPAAPALRSVAAGREPLLTAPRRCQCYAAFSELTASPHDVDAQAAVRARIGAGRELLPASLLALLEEFAAGDIDDLKAGYSGLFEVGSQGPPAPIREDLFTGQKAGTREDLVRFFDFFGYRLDERFAWAPDHLSVELEFMHFLCYHEFADEPERLSWQLAQADFAARHLANWLPGLAAAVARLAHGAYYSRVLEALSGYVADDLAWQSSTITGPAEGTQHG